MVTVALLLVSNVFMTFAWFAYLYMGEPLRWNNAASLACLMGAVGFACWHA
jgi:uncharacterized protein (DUF486 family)